MKNFVSFSNCQGGAVIHFLKKTRMASEFTFTQVNNWQLILMEQAHDLLYESLKTADVLSYQPTGEFLCTNGSTIPPVEELIEHFCQPDCVKISWPYVFNHGFFPLLNVSPGPDGWITAALLKQKVWGPEFRRGYSQLEILKAYNSGRMGFDCARRFVECLAEQSRREQETDIKMGPWILANYRKERLFLTQNHLTSAVFQELAAQIYRRLVPPDAYDCFLPADENEAGMNGVMPVHQAVVDELGLEYPATEGAHEYYRNLLEKMIAGK